MPGELDGFIDSLRQATSLDALTRLVFALRDRLEVEHLVYHSVHSTGRQYAALTYAPEWVAHYVASGYQRLDPVVQECLQRFHPVDWSRLDWSPRAVRRFQGEALDAGVGKQGLSVPIRGPGGQFALVTLSDRRPDLAWERFAAGNLRHLLLIAHFLNQQALTIERGTDRVEGVALSPRETDVLTYLATGMGRGDAAEALGISEHTLRVYVESARLKLGASNTLHAVARALTLGLLTV